MSRFPTGVTVVTSLDASGRPQGMTCSSLASVCLDPPTLLVSLHAGSHTYRAVDERRRFAVNLLHGGGRVAAETFAAPVDRFGELTWERSPSGIPLLTDHSLAIAECTVSNSLAVGDHVVVFGEVVNLYECVSDVPLLYGLREYSSWQGAAVFRS
jgi:flavin reductase (DIM6/NTAB) family NADH-FMN oxidoreductase RutF